MKQSVWKPPFINRPIQIRYVPVNKCVNKPPTFPRSRDPYFLAMERRVEEFVQEEHDYEEMMKDVYERRIPPPPPPNTPHPSTLSIKEGAKGFGLLRKDEGVAKILSINNEGAAEVIWTDQQIRVACIQLKHPFL